MGMQSIVQICLIVISGVAIWTFVMPAFEEIGVVQDEVVRYEQALESAIKANAGLDQMISKLESFTSAERAALDTFLPEEFDQLTTLRDIESIARKNSLLTISLSGEDVSGARTTREELVCEEDDEDCGDPVAPEVAVLAQNTISVQAQGTYQNIKSFLADLERNAYILEPTHLELSPLEGVVGFMAMDLTVEAYSLSVDETEQ